MKHIFVMLTVVIVVAAYSYSRRVSETVVENSIPTAQQSVAEETISSPSKISKLIETPPVDWGAIKERLKLYGAGGFTDSEEEAFNKLHVLPLNWIVQLDCDSLTFLCDLQYEYPPSSYQLMDKAQLEALAYDDPLAAITMGVRFGEGWTDETSPVYIDPRVHSEMKVGRTNWYLRATALSGKTGPLMRLTGIGSEGIVIGIGLARDEEIALHHIAAMMGDPRADPEQAIVDMWDDISSTLMDDGEAQDVFDIQLASSGELVQIYMQYMDQVQRTVTGSTQIIELANVGGPDA